MLEKIRKNVSGILAKILLGLLIVSFAVWGIGDMVRGYGRDIVASVGDQPIKTSDFRQSYQAQLDGISRRFGRRLTPQEAKTFGVEAEVLARLTGAASVDNHVSALNMDISDQAVEKAVYADPNFRGLDGKFSSDRLNDILRQSGLSEKQFFEARKRDAIRAHLTDAILTNVTPPKAMTDMLTTFQGEERIAEYIELTPAKAVKLGTPSDADLKLTYETNKRRFVIPEYRKFQALLLTSAAAKSKIEITEAELRTTYEAEKQSFSVPEQRRIQQIPFADEAKATAAKAELAAGKSFIDVAKSAGASETDINLGMMTKGALIDPAIAEAAFALAKDEVSAPVKGRFRTVLLRVTEIAVGKIRPFEEVKAEIRSQIETERVADKLQELQNNVDDNRLAGKSLKEIGELLKLPFLEVAEADRSGNTSAGKPAITSSDKDQLVRTAFAAEIGVENQVIQLQNDGLAWLNLIAVTPEKQKPMKDVTEELKKVWAELETLKLLREAAAKLAKRINDGAKLPEIATELGVEVKKTPSFKRGDTLTDFPASTVSRVFAMKDGEAAEAGGNDADKRIVVQVAKITAPAPPAAEATKALTNDVSQQLQRDILAQYVTELQKQTPVSFNQAAIDQATGASAQTPYQQY